MIVRESSVTRFRKVSGETEPSLRGKRSFKVSNKKSNSRNIFGAFVSVNGMTTFQRCSAAQLGTLPRRLPRSAFPTSWREARRPFCALGRKNGVQRGLQKTNKFWSHFYIDFWRLGSVLGSQEASKIHPKSMKWASGALPFSTLNGHRFFIDLGYQLGPSENPKSQ